MGGHFPAKDTSDRERVTTVGVKEIFNRVWKVTGNTGDLCRGRGVLCRQRKRVVLLVLKEMNEAVHILDE